MSDLLQESRELVKKNVYDETKGYDELIAYLKDGDYLYVWLHNPKYVTADDTLIRRKNLKNGEIEEEYMIWAITEWHIDFDDFTKIKE